MTEQKLYKILTFNTNGWNLIEDYANNVTREKCDELIQEFIERELKEDINENKIEIIMRLMLMAAIYEFMYMHKTPVKVVISEYLKVCDFFVETTQKDFVNAILDKISKVSRVDA